MVLAEEAVVRLSPCCSRDVGPGFARKRGHTPLFLQHLTGDVNHPIRVGGDYTGYELQEASSVGQPPREVPALKGEGNAAVPYQVDKGMGRDTYRPTRGSGS